MLCKKCGAELKDGRLYCEKCGEPVQMVPDFNPLDEAVRENIAGMIGNTVKPSEGETSSPKSEKAKSTHKKRKLILILSCIIVVAAGLGIFFTARNNSYNYQYGKGLKYFEEQQYDKSVKYLTRAISLNPERSSPRTLLADAYLESGQTGQAVEVLEDLAVQGLATKENYEQLIELYQEQKTPEKIQDLIADCKDAGIQSALEPYRIPAPEADLPSGVYNSYQSVNLESEKGEIHYTLDGTPATAAGILYISTNPIELREGINEIHAVAVTQDGLISPELILEYEIRPDKPIGRQPTAEE